MSAVRRLADARVRLARAQDTALTGRRLGRASDDPVAYGRERRLRTMLRRNQDQSVNADRARLRLAAIEAPLEGLTNVMQRAVELAVLGASATSAGDRETLAVEVEALREQAISLANTRYDGQYLLGGVRSDTPPFDETGSFTGVSRTTEVEILPGVRVATGVTGDQVLAPSGGVDGLAALADLSAALHAGDGATVSELLDPLNAANDQISAARAEVGLRLHSLEVSDTTRDLLSEALEGALAEAAMADPIEAFSSLAQAQQALEAALQVSAAATPPSLLDFLR